MKAPVVLSTVEENASIVAYTGSFVTCKRPNQVSFENFSDVDDWHKLLCDSI